MLLYVNISVDLALIAFEFLLSEAPNGLRYWACGRDADSLDGQKKLRDAENARKAAPYPQVQCTLCWHAFDLMILLLFK